MVRRRRYVSVTIYRVFLAVLLVGIAVFVYRLYSGQLKTEFDIPQVMHLADTYQPGEIYDRNDKKIEPDSESFKDIIGIDIKKTKGNGEYLASHTPWLFGADNNELALKNLLIPSKKKQGGDVKITIDKDLQEYLAKTASDKGYKKQYLIVSNWKTGELLGMYSNSGNCLTDVLAPGSTMKPFFLAAALTADPGLKEYTYDCEGTVDVGVMINCAGKAHHGRSDLNRAMALSCNGYFISMLEQMNETERDKMLAALKKWGFDGSYSFSQLRYSDHTFCGDNTNRMYFSVIGQGNCKITPFFLNCATGGLLRGGKMAEPVWIKGKRVSGDRWKKIESTKEYEMCSEEVATTVVDAMTAVTQYGTARQAVIPGYELMGKTGTAQIADERGNLSGTYTVWYTGAVKDEKSPYAVTVCIDDVLADEATSLTAALYAREITEYVLKSGGNES